MGIEDRDWYREEYANRNGRTARHELGRKKPADDRTIEDFLKAEREKKEGASYGHNKFRSKKSASNRNRWCGAQQLWLLDLCAAY